MVSDSEFNKIKEQAWDDAEKFMSKEGYFFSDNYSSSDIKKLENILWNASKSYIRNELSSSAYNVICSDYQGNPVYYSLSPEAVDLIAYGLELDYSMYVKQDKEKLDEIHNKLKNLTLSHFDLI